MNSQQENKQNEASELKIRPVSQSDIRRLHNIEIHSFKSPYSYKLLEKLAHTPNIIYLVAEIDRTIIGYTIISLRSKQAHIISIAIDEKYRKQGFGSTLLQKNIEKLQKMNIEKLKLEVGVNNEPAKAFYAKFNFKPIKIRPKYYPDNEDGLVMELYL